MESLVRAKPKASRAVQESIQVASGAALVGLFVHYTSFYVLATPLLTDQIAEWIMARTPSRYAVPILDVLGQWAKPSAATGALAILGFTIFLIHVSSRQLRPWPRLAAFAIGGTCSAGFLAWNTGYSSYVGSATFWFPALVVAGVLRALARTPRPEMTAEPDPTERRTMIKTAARYALPVVMSSGVVAVAAESYIRAERSARKAREPVDLFPFLPALDRERFGSGLLRKPVTPLSEFYGMSKNTVDPVVDTASWRLSIAVNGTEVRSYGFEELLRIKQEIRYVTLRCISNTLKSDLMGTAEWAGVRLDQLMERHSLPPNVIEAAFIGVEGHDDSLPLDYAFGDETLLAIGMNGKTLSRTHGFPIRLLAPRYYGCRNVKWISRIDFVSKPYYGTWQRLGYTKEPVIHTASHIDHIRRSGPAIEMGGVSFAGSRGIRAVRVRTDGAAWQQARIESPLSPFTWTRWMAQLNAPLGAVIEANAQDGTGAWQELAERSPFPSGPIGPTIVVARV